MKQRLMNAASVYWPQLMENAVCLIWNMCYVANDSGLYSIAPLCLICAFARVWLDASALGVNILLQEQWAALLYHHTALKHRTASCSLLT